MADAWGLSWGIPSAWGDSWGTRIPTPPDVLGGTTSRGGDQGHHPAFTKKKYRELIAQWAREAAAKTAAIVDAKKKVAATEKAVIAVAKDATAADAAQLQRLWADTAAKIAASGIYSKYQTMADDLAAHFGRLAAEQEDEEIVALLLS